MVSPLETIFARDQFCKALDDLRLPQYTNAVVVLRNMNKRNTEIRLDWAYRLLAEGRAGGLVLPMQASTKGEAEWTRQLALKVGWTSILLVTEPYHSYRAYLTFLKEFGSKVRLYVSCPPCTHFDANDIEFQKIEEYREKGDVASYEEGVWYLANLN
jgi:hypothetical protein